MLGQTVNWDYQWGQVVGRAWADDDFKRRLLADPAGVLGEYDLGPPAGLRVVVHEEPARVPPSSDDMLHLVLPVKPSEDELSEDDLCGVGGGGAFAYCWCRCRCGGCGGCGACGACGCGRCGCHHPPRPDEEV
jgi:hypothetical protein